MRARATAPSTGTSRPPSLISTPAFASAKIGMMPKFTQGTSILYKRSCNETLSLAPRLSIVNTSYCSLRSFVSPESTLPTPFANWATTPFATTAFAGTERPRSTPAIVGCTPDLTKNAHTAIPVKWSSSMLRTPMRKNTLNKARSTKAIPRALKLMPSPLG